MQDHATKSCEILQESCKSSLIDLVLMHYEYMVWCRSNQQHGVKSVPDGQILLANDVWTHREIASGTGCTGL